MTQKSKSRSHHIGHFAEIIAAIYLTLKGYRVIRRRYQSPVGEIDLIATKKKTLIAIEVKFRKTSRHTKQNPEQTFETIHKKNQRRVTRAIEHFLSRKPHYHAHNIQFDAVIINWPPSIRHLDNAWQGGS